MRIGDIVNVRDRSGWEGVPPFWKGKVTEIHNKGEITVQDKGIKFAVLNMDDLIFKKNEYWEK